MGALPPLKGPPKLGGMPRFEWVGGLPIGPGPMDMLEMVGILRGIPVPTGPSGPCDMGLGPAAWILDLRIAEGGGGISKEG